VAETAGGGQRAGGVTRADPAPIWAPMSAPVLAYENLGLVQGSGWLFRGLDLFVGRATASR
jgi:hypothetical protein